MKKTFSAIWLETLENRPRPRCLLNEYMKDENYVLQTKLNPYVD